MSLLLLTYTRDAATVPTQTGGRAEGARQGGGSGVIYAVAATRADINLLKDVSQHQLTSMEIRKARQGPCG